MRSLLVRLARRLPVKLIYDNGRPFLQRFHLVMCERLGFRIYLHRFIASDPDRGLHNHPWAWAFTLILVGCYDEERRDGTHRRRWFYLIPSGDVFHRVILPKGMKEVWTIFIHGRYTMHWGFMRPEPERLASWGGKTVWPSWRSREGGRWAFQARDRDGSAFSDWHRQPNVLRGAAVLRGAD